MTKELEKALRHIKTRADLWAVREVEKALSQEPCGDVISRKKAICVISACDGKSAQIEALEQLPSVTQKSGKWIDYSDEGFVECPFCGYATNCEDNIDELHYCFYCGARMESENETWNGIHGQITAPKGTFKKIFDDAESEDKE